MDMRKIKDLTGMKFGRLTVLKYSHYQSTCSYYLCLCDCGITKAIRSYNLKSAITSSCGCIEKERKHEFKEPYIYDLWLHIKGRCYRQSDQAYDRYGGRGITMYEPWINDFKSFRQWIIENLGQKSSGESIDRIENDGNYEPGNLKWSSAQEQSCHTRKRNNKTPCSSKYIGVIKLFYKQRRNVWKCKITFNQKIITWLFEYTDEGEYNASLCYDYAKRLYHPTDDCLNHPDITEYPKWITDRVDAKIGIKNGKN